MPIIYVHKLNDADNAATAIREIPAGCEVYPGVTALEAIPFGYKIALCDLCAGAPVIKYGVAIGTALSDIKKGALIHIHNVVSRCDHRSAAFDAVTSAPQDMRYMPKELIS